jgi:quercetin dioxygenase-like cupin family protein
MDAMRVLARFLRDPAELDYVERPDGLHIADLGIAGVNARVVKYAAGDEIPAHYHTKPSVKALLRGAIAFENEDGPIGTGQDGTLYWCGSGIYRGHVLEDSYLLVIDELGSERIAVESSG